MVEKHVWTKEGFEQTNESPQDVMRKIEWEEVAEKYKGDWLVRLFSPLGVREILEMEMVALMNHLGQTYESVMSMPVSRRKRMLETFQKMLERKM